MRLLLYHACAVFVSLRIQTDYRLEKARKINNRARMAVVVTAEEMLAECYTHATRFVIKCGSD
jgi:hypothetical protein